MHILISSFLSIQLSPRSKSGAVDRFFVKFYTEVLLIKSSFNSNLTKATDTLREDPHACVRASSAHLAKYLLKQICSETGTVQKTEMRVLHSMYFFVSLMSFEINTNERKVYNCSAVRTFCNLIHIYLRLSGIRHVELPTFQLPYSGLCVSDLYNVFLRFQ